MAARVEIKDEASAQAWLERQDHQTQVWFAARCGLRVLPVAIASLQDFGDDRNSLSLLRAFLIGVAAATSPLDAKERLKEPARQTSHDLKAIVHSASAGYAGSSAISAALSMLSAIKEGNSAATSAIAASSSAMSTARSLEVLRDELVSDGLSFSDAEDGAYDTFFQVAAEDAGDVQNWQKLWPSNMPRNIGISVAEMRSQFERSPSQWSFWLAWYNAILNGTPLPWELTVRIALEITDAEWDDGPTTVARRINEIQRDYQTSVTPRLIRLEGGLWDVEQDAEVAAEPIDFAIAQVEIALTAALSADRGNGLKDTSGETVLIRKACAEFRTLPSVVATSLWNACMGLQRNIGDVYPDDAALIALQNTLFTSVEELCEQDPLIRDRVARLAALETRRMPTPEEREDLRQVPEMVAQDLTLPALEQLTDAIEIVSTAEKPPRVWRARLVNWLSILGRGLDQVQRNEKRASWLLKLGRKISGWFFDPDK